MIEKIIMMLNYRQKLPNSLSDLIDIYVIPWGEYQGVMANVNFLQLNYLKEDLQSVMGKDQEFSQSITLIDLIAYNKIMGSDTFHCLNSSLLGAAKHGSLNLVKYFLSKGADNYQTATERAGAAGHLHIVKYFVDKGVHMFGWIIYKARENHQFHVVDYLESLCE